MSSSLPVGHPGNIADALPKLVDIALVQFFSPLCLARSPPLAKVFVRQAFRFGLGQPRFLDQQSLPLVAPAGATEFQYHGRQSGMFLGAPREGGIARGQKGQVVEIGARETKRAVLAVQNNPGVASQFFATLVTGGIATRDEHLQVGTPTVRHSLLRYTTIIPATWHGRLSYGARGSLQLRSLYRESR